MENKTLSSRTLAILNQFSAFLQKDVLTQNMVIAYRDYLLAFDCISRAHGWQIPAVYVEKIVIAKTIDWYILARTKGLSEEEFTELALQALQELETNPPKFLGENSVKLFENFMRTPGTYSIIRFNQGLTLKQQYC